MDSVRERSAWMCLGSVVEVVAVLSSSEEMPQVPMEPLETGGHSSSRGTPAAPVGFFFPSCGNCPALSSQKLSHKC